MILSVHGIWFGIGAIVTAQVYFRLQKKTGELKIYHAYEDTAALLFVGLVGARLAYALFTQDVSAVIDYVSFWRLGLISYGGIVTGSVALWWITSRREQSERYRDWLSLSVLVGWAVGRLGNFFAQDAYGVENSLFGGFFYGRVPIQLYETASLLFLFGAGFLMLKAAKPGWVYWYALASYGLVRFMIDFWRDLPKVLLELNISQLFALAIFIYGMIGMLIWRKRKQP